MSRQFTDQVNARLYQAKLLLQLQRDQLDAQQLTDSPLACALQESVVQQIHLAYCDYLAEVAVIYLQSVSELTVYPVVDLHELIAGLQVKGVNSPELAEMKSLLADNESWLFQLLSAVNQIKRGKLSGQAKFAANNSEAEIPLNVIPVLAIGEDEQPGYDVTVFENWLAALNDLIARQREALQEW